MRLARILNEWSQPPFWANPDQGIWMNLMAGEKETIGNDFNSYVNQAYRANGVIFALILARAILFSQARFMWREFEDGRPGELHDNPNLQLLRRPWPNGTTNELLFSMEQDASLAGNAYWVKVPADGLGPERLRRLRPDWVKIVTGSPTEDPFDYRAQPVGYEYEPKGGNAREKVLFTPERVVHYSPQPDPAAQWRGMSWLTPVLDEIKADKAATKHKLRYFERGTTGGLVVTYDKSIGPDNFEKYKKLFNQEHDGVTGAYKTFHIGGGSDIKTVGADLQQLEFKVTQGAGESRLAAAARVPPSVAGLSEGLQGAALNAGNFSASRRLFVDMFGVWAWSGAAAAFESILKRPGDNFELDYDARNIPFMREDALEEAKILKENASTIETLWRTGAVFDSVIQAVRSNDITKLVHDGSKSVQIQAGTAPAPETEEEPPREDNA